MGKTKRSNRTRGGKTRKYLGGVNNDNPLLGKSMTIKLFFDGEGLFMEEPLISKKQEKKTKTAKRIIKDATGTGTDNIKSVIDDFLKKNTNIDVQVAEFYVPQYIQTATKDNIVKSINDAIGVFTAEKERKKGIGIGTTDGNSKYQEYVDALTDMRNAIGNDIDAEYNNGKYPIFPKELSKRPQDIKNLIANLKEIKGPYATSNGVSIRGYKIDVFDKEAISGFLVSLFKSPYDDTRVKKSGFSSKYKNA